MATLESLTASLKSFADNEAFARLPSETLEKLQALASSLKSHAVNEAYARLPPSTIEKLEALTESLQSVTLNDTLARLPPNVRDVIARVDVPAIVAQLESAKIALTTLKYQDALVSTVAAGLGSYFIFKRYEPSGPFALFFLLLAFPALLTPLLLPHYEDWTHAVATTFGTYLATIIGSTVFYRISPFHPLAKIPGPFLNKITKFRMAYISHQGKMHEYYQNLHRKYGDFVRIGPNEVSIADVGSIIPLMGANGWPKGPNWDGRIPAQTTRSLIALNNAKEHARRRQFWNRAFNSSALKDYEPVITRRSIELAEQLEKQKGPLDLSRWLCYFTYDFMSDMVFGGGTDMLHDHDKDGLWHMLDGGQPLSLFLGHVPWLAQYWMKLPGAGSDLIKHMKMARARAFRRASAGSVTKDLYYYLNDEGGYEPVRPSMSQVVNDGGLAIIAGSDTTSITLANLFYFLMANPKAYKRLQEETDKFFPPGENVFDASQHAQLHYLNAVINETLRLYPPLMSGSQRAAEKGHGGKALGPHYLPEGTQAFIHTYSLHRDPRNFFPAPEEFAPERWLPADQPGSFHAPGFKGEVRHNTAAYIPFSFGPAVCVGKNLAYQEMRMTISLLVQKFELAFAPGFEPRVWEDNLNDLYVTTRGPLPVVVKPREGVVINK
ncbi:hypothetical protein PLICRDRAFT_52981 [Plicaturopsis crispa FD-325 SS-3]|nr:hypothetical protein PLICRDRAFT_52981 [Plicaturopsis crispa FD-325 SS-3]